MKEGIKIREWLLSLGGPSLNGFEFHLMSDTSWRISKSEFFFGGKSSYDRQTSIIQWRSTNSHWKKDWHGGTCSRSTSGSSRTLTI